MKHNLVFLSVLLVCMASLLAWRATRAPVEQVATPAPQAPPPVSSLPDLATLEATPQVRSYRQRQQFERDTHDFLDQAASMPPLQRSRLAKILEREIEHHEHAGDLMAGEALMLRLALLRATEEDPLRLQMATAELTEHYRIESDRRLAAFANQQRNDPRLRQYKAREASIVAEVMAMPQPPPGLTREQYLRQRLQGERERAYATGAQ